MSTTRRQRWGWLLTAATLCGCVDGGVDAGPRIDAGVWDAGAVDAGADAGALDAGSLDAGALDAGAGLDGGGVDAGEDGGTTAIDPACTVDGCVRASQKVASATRDELVGVVPASVVIDHGYDVYWVRYVTRGREARAVMTIPLASEVAPPPGGFHLVINAPGTVGLGDDCAIAFSVAGAGLAGTFGARGMVGVSLDYPGIGTVGPHPYLVGDVEGDTMLHAVMAAETVLALNAVQSSGRVALVGLSQGGHAALSASKRLATTAPHIDVRAVAVAGPATVALENWAASVAFAGPHIVYHALLTRAWQLHYGAATTEEVWNDAAVDVVNRTDTVCLISEGTTLASTPAEGGIGLNPSAIFSSAFLNAFAAGTPDAFEDAGFGFMAQGFAANRIVPWTSSHPIKIFQGTDDDVVLASSITAVVDELRAGGMTVELELVDGGGHTDVAFSFLAVPQRRTEEALSWLRAALDAN